LSHWLRGPWFDDDPNAHQIRIVRISRDEIDGLVAKLAAMLTPRCSARSATPGPTRTRRCLTSAGQGILETGTEP
jgi:hypothetical protein